MKNILRTWVAAVMIIAMATAATPAAAQEDPPAGPPTPTNSATFVGGVVDTEAPWANARKWARDLRCEGITCDGNLRVGVYNQCQAPVFTVKGSFIIPTDSWNKNTNLIVSKLNIEAVRDISPNYMLIKTKGAEIAAMRALQLKGVAITANTINFHNTLWWFYPHSAPQKAKRSTPSYDPKNGVGFKPMSNVVTIDTGIVATANKNLNHGLVGLPKHNMDLAPADDVTGHGPAIADLIGDIGGLPESGPRSQSSLKEVMFRDGGVGSSVVHSDGTRGLDAASLLATLETIDPAQTDVLNLSLGVKTCKSFTTIRVQDRQGNFTIRQQADPIRQWIIDHPSIMVVAAAGNSGSSIPTYPAAWTRDPAVPNIISVGSMGTDGTRSCFSDHGRWVDFYTVGENVVVEHPTMGRVVWSGTSFSAPQVSAAISVGVNPKSVGLRPFQVPKPSARNEAFCK